MVAPKILVVEDEELLQELLTYNLRRAGYHPISSLNGTEAFEIAVVEKPALILLDLMLPDTDGFAVCKHLRSRTETEAIPIIMLTAREQAADIVRGLELGADDYITKPFDMPVLFARIGAVLRRRERSLVGEAEQVQVGAVVLHPGRREVRVSGQTVQLANTEFRILHLLMRRPGWVFTRNQIVDGAQGDNYAVTDRAVDVQIVGLRKKLGAAAAYIETVRGVGYRFRDD